MAPLLAQIEFAAPWWLLGLGALAPLAWLTWSSGTRFAPGQRIASFVCRGLILLAVLLALAGMSERWLSDERRVVLVIDQSESTRGAPQEAARKFVADVIAARGTNEVLVVPFARDAQGASSDWPTSEIPADERFESDPAAALLRAAGLCDAAYVPSVVLLSDGRATRGDLIAAASGMKLPVSTLAMGPPAGPEVCLARLEADESSGETAVRATIVCSEAGKGTIEIIVGGEVRERRETQLAAGESRVEFATPPSTAGEQKISVALVGFADTDPRNNRRELTLAPRPAPTVLLVARERAGDSPLANALRAQGYAVDARSPSALPGEAELARFATIIVHGIAPADLSPPQWTALRKQVEERGAGLLVLGGEATFAPERFAGTPLEALTPVKAQAKQEERERVLGLMLVLDKSASMLEENRLELAKVAARKAVEVLSPADQVGIIAFGTDVNWVVEPGPAADKGAIVKKIEALQAVGRTNMFPALQRAALALQQTRADRRHLILLTDGVPSPGDFVALARELAAAEVTVTTVSVSAGAEQSLLQDISRIAGGRHFHAANPADLAGILERETRVAARDLAGTFVPQTYRQLPGLDLAGMPPLDGAVATSPKPGSELLLIANMRNPLLSWWRLGRGTVVAFTAEPQGATAAAFAKWPGFGPFFQRLARHVRPPAAARGKVSIQAAEDATIIAIDARHANGALVTDAQVEVHTDWNLPQSAHWPAVPQVAPGRYELRIPTTAPTALRVEATVTSPAGVEKLIGYYSRDFADELIYGAPNASLLQHVAAVTGGKFNPTPVEVFAPDERRVERVTEWWPRLLIAALLLFVLDVALKRFAWSPSP